jgi:hypothetical protein
MLVQTKALFLRIIMVLFRDDKTIMEHTTGNNTDIILRAPHGEEFFNVEGQDLSRKYFATHAKQLPGLAKLALFVSTDNV